MNTTASNNKTGPVLIGLTVVVVLMVGVGPLLLAVPAGMLMMFFAGTSSDGSLGGNGCAAAPVVNMLSAEQTAAARTIYSAVAQVGSEQQWEPEKTRRAAIIALITVQQESSLGVGERWRKPNGDGDAGWFQQRTLPGWYGTVAEVNDPVYGTRTFLLGKKLAADEVAAAGRAGSTPAGPVGYQIPGLINIPGWETMPAGKAAQSVQRSAYPDRYAAHEPLARTLVASFDNTLTSSCTNAGMGGCPATTLVAEARLTPDALQVLRCGSQKFPTVGPWYGVGDRPATVDDDHQTGRALDAMLPNPGSPQANQLGDQLAGWLKDNATQLGVRYIIWQTRIWSANYHDQGWVACGGLGTNRSTGKASCYIGPNDTLAHRDHVHVSVFGQKAQPVGGGGSVGDVVSPVAEYTITARFGQAGRMWARRHTGLDLANQLNTPTRAVAAGTVLVAGRGPKSGWAGRYVEIRHADGTVSLYAHHNEVTVQAGQTVTPGQQIGLMGATGNVTGVHLHLQIHPNGGAAINPETWLARNGVQV